MKNYIYKCFDCNSEYTPKEIENNVIYLCPNCGTANRNEPLKGVLNILYDYEIIKENVCKEHFLKNPVGEIWIYPYLLPLETENHKITNIDPLQFEKLRLTKEPIYNIEKNLQIFDDTRNPTLSYKDRATQIIILKALQLGIDEISAASTGNAGSSLAGICAKLGITSHIFVPKNIPASKRIQIQSYGANIYLVDGSYDDAFDLCLDVSKEKGWYNRNTAYNPLTIEGKKSSAYDIFISQKGEVPDYIFVSVGDGVIISGIYKGFWELKQLGWIEKIPKLIGVQAKGSDAVVRYLSTGEFNFIEANTIADSISAGAPRNLFMAAHSVKESGGEAISVADEEIINAQKILTTKYGVLAEPSASASYAGFTNLKKEKRISENSSVLLMITGHGLKDVSSLEKWNDSPKIKSTEEWMKELI